MHQRNERIAELIRQEISVILRDVKDPGLMGLLTVTDLKLTRDRKSAVVFYSMLGTAEEKKSTAKALERSVPFVRKRLAERLSLRSIPKVVFEYDPTPERAQRVEALLHAIEEEKKGGH